MKFDPLSLETKRKLYDFWTEKEKFQEYCAHSRDLKFILLECRNWQ